MASMDSAGVAPIYGLRKIGIVGVRQSLQIKNDIARRKHLAYAVGGARRGAATAFGAGIEIEQVFPGKTRQGVDAELFLRVEIDTARFRRPASPRGVDVQRGRNNVGHLRIGGPRQKAEDQCHVEPPRRGVGGLHRFDRHQAA